MSFASGVKARRLAAEPWLVMPVVAVVLLAGWWFLRPGDDGDAGASSAAATGEQTARLVEATMGSQAQTLTATGTIAAAETADLSFSSAGTVTAVNVEAGDVVIAGQVLASIEPVDLDAAVAEAEADVADAEAKLDDDTDAGASDAQLAADEANLQSAEDRLAAAEEDREGADLVADFDGTVASVDLTVGEQLGSSGGGGTSMTGSGSGSGMSSSSLGSSSQDAGMGSGQTTTTAQIQVVSTGRYTVELGFDSTDVANLAEGQSASVVRSTSTSSTSGAGGFGGGGFPGGGFGNGGFPGGGGQGFQLGGPSGSSAGAGSGAGAGEGTDEESDAGTSADPSADPSAGTTIGDAVTGEVIEVGKVASATSGVATYPVTVTFEDTSGGFNVGAAVSVTITYAEGDEALLVPAMAVTTEDDVSTVQVSVDGELETREVTVGDTVDNMTAITSGLDEGDQVALSFGRMGGGGGGEIPGGDGSTAGFPGADGSEVPAMPDGGEVPQISETGQ